MEMVLIPAPVLQEWIRQFEVWRSHMFNTLSIRLQEILRAVIGVIVVGAGVYFQRWWGLVGLIPLGTAAVRWCPLYLPFKISTDKTAKSA